MTSVGQAAWISRIASLQDTRQYAEMNWDGSFEDYRDAAHPALRHRIILNCEGEAEGIKQDAIIDQILEQVPTRPREGMVEAQA